MSEKLTDIPAKTLSDIENFYKQTVADPNADNDYLRGYNNGIRLCYATVFAHEPILSSLHM